MNKKFISMFVMVAILMFSISCYSTKVHKGLKLRYQTGKHYKIFWVVTESGQRIRFYGNDGAKIMGGNIIGETLDGHGNLKVVRIPINKIEKVKMKAQNNIKTLLLVVSIGTLATFFGLFILFGINFQ